MSVTGDRYTAPDFRSAALITIDMQCDFLDGGVAAIPGTTAVLPQIVALLAAFRQATQPIVHVVRLYEPDGANVDLCRRALVESGRRMVCSGTLGAEIADAMRHGPDRLDAAQLLAGQFQALGPREWAMYKPRWGAFYQTHLEEWLRAEGVSTVVFAGCNFPNCPRTSIYEASERDFRVVLAGDGVSGLYDRGRDELTNIGIAVLPTATIIAALAASMTAKD